MRGRCPTRISRTDAIGPATPHTGWFVTLGQFPYNPAIISSPTIDKLGNIYVAVEGVGPYSGGLLSLAPDGGTRWFHDSASYGMRPGATLTAGDAVISASSDGTIFSFDLDGGINWSVNVGHTVIGDPLIGVDGTIYIGDQSGHLYAFNPDGGTAWTMSLGFGSGSVRSITQSADGFLWVIDSSTLWHVNPDGGQSPTGINSMGIVQAPVTVGPHGNIWFGDEYGNLYAATAQGAPLLQVPYALNGVTHFFNNPAAGYDERVFFSAPNPQFALQTLDSLVFTSTADGGTAVFHAFDGGIQAQLVVDGAGSVYAIEANVLVAMNADGGVRWTFGLDNGVQTGMAFGADGTIYVGTVGGTIYAITP